MAAYIPDERGTRHKTKKAGLARTQKGQKNSSSSCTCMSSIEAERNALQRTSVIDEEIIELRASERKWPPFVLGVPSGQQRNQLLIRPALPLSRLQAMPMHTRLKFLTELWKCNFKLTTWNPWSALTQVLFFDILQFNLYEVKYLCNLKMHH